MFRMRLRSAYARALVVLIAIVQMAMPGVASVADAWLTAQRPSEVRVHAEDRTHANCARLYADDCVLCTFLAHCIPGALAERGALPLTTPYVPRGNLVPALQRRVAVLLARPRAPPVG
jgi:hypothetical protein